MSNVESFIRFCDSDFGATVMDREAMYLAQYMNPDDRILNVGAGIGSIEGRLTRHDIVGIDISKEMVRTARSRVENQFIIGDARALPIFANTMDAVLSAATLEFIPEVELVLDEAVRVLHPGGVMAALILNTESAYVQSNLARDDSYFQKMVHRDSDKLASMIEQRVNGDREYFLGIADQSVFETDDPTEAAMMAITGNPTS